MSYGYLYGDTLADPGQRIFGTPGGSLNSAGFDASSTSAGIDGERRVGSVLDKIANDNRGVFVFHSFKLPGHYGDIDHVMLIGKTVVVIDTKNWKSRGRYTFYGDESVLRDGREFPGGKVKVGNYVNEVRGYSGMRTVGFLAVANRTAETERRSGDWDFVNLSDLERELKSIVRSEGGGYEYSPSDIVFLTSRVVDPAFSGSWDAVVAIERQKKGAHSGIPTGVAQSGNTGYASLAWWSHFLVFPVFLFNFFLSFGQHYQPWKYWLFGAFALAYGMWVRSETKYSRWRKGRILTFLGGGIIGVTLVIAVSTGTWWA